ncbi:MAG: GNAT family N-acetyltransferase [Actinomycetota bacterium]|nr:GNAT family N-acetyltransferase [Actinomycetota bacterium]
MARRLRPLGLEHIGDLPCECTGCVFWETPRRLEIRCGAACDVDMLRQWYLDTTMEWGEVGRIACEDDQVLGFIKYAPACAFPQATRMPAGPAAPDVPLLACIHIRDDARQHGLGRVLLQAALRDLSLRGEKSVQAYATTRRDDMIRSPVMGMEFLLRHGFTVARPHPEYPLLQLDLRSLATWTENLEAVLQTLRIPLGHPRRVPSPVDQA